MLTLMRLARVVTLMVVALVCCLSAVAIWIVPLPSHTSFVVAIDRILNSDLAVIEFVVLRGDTKPDAARRLLYLDPELRGLSRSAAEYLISVTDNEAERLYVESLVRQADNQP